MAGWRVRLFFGSGRRQWTFALAVVVLVLAFGLVTREWLEERRQIDRSVTYILGEIDYYLRASEISQGTRKDLILRQLNQALLGSGAGIERDTWASSVAWADSAVSGPTNPTATAARRGRLQSLLYRAVSSSYPLQLNASRALWWFVLALVYQCAVFVLYQKVQAVAGPDYMELALNVVDVSYLGALVGFCVNPADAMWPFKYPPAFLLVITLVSASIDASLQYQQFKTTQKAHPALRTLLHELPYLFVFVAAYLWAVFVASLVEMLERLAMMVVIIIAVAGFTLILRAVIHAQVSEPASEGA